MEACTTNFNERWAVDMKDNRGPACNQSDIGKSVDIMTEGLKSGEGTITGKSPAGNAIVTKTDGSKSIHQINSLRPQTGKLSGSE